MRMALQSCALVAAVVATPLSGTADVDLTGKANLLFITVDTLRADYLGVYGSVGYEWDPAPSISMGPEVRLVVADGEGSLGTEVLTQIAFHFLFHF